MYEALVARVRYHIQKANFMGLKEAESTLLLAEAADAIEELSKCVGESIPKGDAEIIIAEVAKPRWIPATERLPEDFQKVLVFWREHSEPMIDTAFWQKDAKQFEGEHWVRMEDKVTHWMPLPQPPEEETK